MKKLLKKTLILSLSRYDFQIIESSTKESKVIILYYVL